MGDERRSTIWKVHCLPGEVVQGMVKKQCVAVVVEEPIVPSVGVNDGGVFGHLPLDLSPVVDLAQRCIPPTDFIPSEQQARVRVVGHQPVLLGVIVKLQPPFRQQIAQDVLLVELHLLARK